MSNPDRKDNNDKDNKSNSKIDSAGEKILKIADKLEKIDKDRAAAKENKAKKKEEKANLKIEKNQKREINTKKLLAEADFSEMSTQQKIWVVLKLIIYAGTPFLIYMITPAIVIAVGTVLLSGSTNNMSEHFSDTATNFYTFFGIIAALIYLAVNAKKRGSTISKDITISFENLNYRYLLYMFIFGFCASMTVSSLYSLIPDSIMAVYDSYALDLKGGYDLDLALLSVCLLDPIAEEIVFRGYMLNRMLPTVKEKASIWIVTIVFSLCHLSLFWIIYGLLLGWVLAKISIRHDNILYSIVIHIGFNFPTLLNFIIVNNQKLNDALFGHKIMFVFYALIFGLCSYVLLCKYNEAENIGLNLKIRKK